MEVIELESIVLDMFYCILYLNQRMISGFYLGFLNSMLHSLGDNLRWNISTASRLVWILGTYTLHPISIMELNAMRVEEQNHFKTTSGWRRMEILFYIPYMTTL